jgi:rhodanese-related sulfurtransferase
MKKMLIATFIISMLVFSGVSISATSNNTTHTSMPQGFKDCPINITVNEAWDMLNNPDDGTQIPIDVRRDDEWNSGYIDTPWPECPRWYIKDLFSNETWLPIFLEMYAGEEIILYCKGGYRSYLVSLILCDSGFTGTIYNMLGGITDWMAQGYPIRNNTAPDAPTIDGPTTVKKNVDYDFTFSADDAENDGVYFWVEWCGDGHCAKWNGPFPSGTEITLNHSFHKIGTFSIRAKTKDFYENESGWSEFEITVPRYTSYKLNFLEHLYTRFPHAFSIIKHVLGL